MRLFRIIAALVVLAATLAAGIALGMALHDNPRPSGPIIVDRTVTLPSETPPSGVTVPAGP